MKQLRSQLINAHNGVPEDEEEAAAVAAAAAASAEVRKRTEAKKTASLEADRAREEQARRELAEKSAAAEARRLEIEASARSKDKQDLEEESRRRQEEEAILARVRRGMLRVIAEGPTTAERQHRSHTASRGEWVVEASHFPGTQSVWVGCGCNRREHNSWCLTYKGGFGLDDQESADAHAKTEAALSAETQQRLAAGMPSEIAVGRTLQLRKWLSHTRNDCPGTTRCGKRGPKCAGAFVKSPDGSTEYWSCCRSGMNLWCTNYDGPRL